MDAERAMVDLKKAELMLDHLLEEEDATVVGVSGSVGASGALDSVRSPRALNIFSDIQTSNLPPLFSSSL